MSSFLSSDVPSPVWSIPIIRKLHSLSVTLLDGNKGQEGKPHKEEKPRSLYENLEDSFATKAAEEICLQQKELRVFEISGLVLLNENIQKINPNEPLKEECTTLDEVSWLENHRNVSAIKRSDSPIESDRIMKLPVEVPEGAEKPAEEYENNKELIIEKERDIKEFPAVSIEVE